MDANVETMAFLHVHGLDVEPKGLNATLREAIKALKALYYPGPRQDGLTAAEVEVLCSGGLDPTPRPYGEQGDPLLKGVLAYASLVETGLTTLQVAKMLQVSDARIRQRLQDRTLLAIKCGRSWKLPLFQFAGERELPGWAEVAHQLPQPMSPVAVESWLRTPNSELVAGEEEKPISPRDWLLAGRPPQPVACLAAGLS